MIELKPVINDGYTRESSLGFTYRPLVGDARRYALGVILEADSPRLQAKAILSGCVVSGEPDWDNNWQEISERLTGLMHVDEERADASNLRDGVRLLALHPEVAGRSCDSCRHWWYKQDGTIARGATGNLLRRHGVVPCETMVGCPKGHHTNQAGLSAKNEAAYRHYKECRATHNFPDDPIVRSNAVIISQAEESAYWERLGGLLGKSARVHGHA